MNYKNLNLKQGEVALFNDSSNTYYKFHNIIEACKRAVNAGRTPENGWNIVDDLGITYEKEDWAFFAQLPLPKDQEYNLLRNLKIKVYGKKCNYSEDQEAYGIAALC